MRGTGEEVNNNMSIAQKTVFCICVSARKIDREAARKMVDIAPRDGHNNNNARHPGPFMRDVSFRFRSATEFSVFALFVISTDCIRRSHSSLASPVQCARPRARAISNNHASGCFTSIYLRTFAKTNYLSPFLLCALLLFTILQLDSFLRRKNQSALAVGIPKGPVFRQSRPNNNNIKLISNNQLAGCPNT